MPKKRLKCFAIISRGEYYRPGGRILTVHAVSIQHAKRLLKASGKLSKKKVSVKQNFRCDPQSGESCYYKLLAQPSYGKTLWTELVPNSPEWNKRVESEKKFKQEPKIPKRRRNIIDSIRIKRPDLYD